MKTFNQQKLFTKNEYKITESKLLYNVSKFGNSNEIVIPYENIDGERVSLKSSNGFSLVATIILYSVGIMTHIDSYSYGENRNPYYALYWFVLGTIMLIVYYFSRKEIWKLKLSDNSYLFIYKKIPSEEKTNQFLSDLIETRNNYLRENYAIIDENINYENQLSNFRWLKSINAISKKEFEEKYAELKRTVKPDKTNIGFGK